MSVTIQQRRDLAANWTAANPVLHQGEFGEETDTAKLKLGDGITAWTSLGYWGGSGGGGGAVSSVFGRTGTVAATPGDYTASQVTGAVSAVPPSGDTTGVTDVTNLQAALTAAQTAGSGIVRGQAAGIYWINAALVIGSGTTLDMTGCTVNEVSGSNCNMLIDSAHSAGTLTVPSPVTNITVRGGIWDRQNNSGPNINTGSAGLGRHMFILGGQHLTVRDMTIQSTGAVGGAKYAFLIQNAVNFIVENMRGSLYISDFCHIDGPASYGVIREIYTTGNKDDTVALSPTDWAGNIFGNEGDITDILIENIFSDQQEVASIVALYSGKVGSTVLNVRRIKIKNIHGYVWASAYFPIFIGDTSQVPAQAGVIDDIVIDGLDCIAGAASGIAGTQPLVSINSINPSTSIGVGSVTVRNVTVRCDLDSVVKNWAPLAYLRVEGVTGATTANPFGNGLIHQQGALATIGQLDLSDVHVTSAGTQGGSLIAAVTSGQGLTEAFLNNIWCSNVAYLASLITATTLNLNNVHMLGNADLINASTGAVVTVATTGTCNFAVPTSTGAGTASPFGSLAPVCDLGVTGYALANGTGVIPGMSWTAPSDGRMHTVVLSCFKAIATLEAGGACKLYATTSQSVLLTVAVFNGTSAAGVNGAPGGVLPTVLVEPGQSVSFQQTSALTSGASTVFAQMWAA